MREPSTATVRPTETERELAAEIVRHGISDDQLVELVATTLAAARAAGHAAGLEESADEAHAAGYAEGYDIGRRDGQRGVDHDGEQLVEIEAEPIIRAPLSERERDRRERFVDADGICHCSAKITPHRHLGDGSATRS